MFKARYEQINSIKIISSKTKFIKSTKRNKKAKRLDAELVLVKQSQSQPLMSIKGQDGILKKMKNWGCAN